MSTIFRKWDTRDSKLGARRSNPRFRQSRVQKHMSEKDLAPGALPPDGFIPLSVPQLVGNEWKYVKECLDTNWVSSVGSLVHRFEQTMASYIGCRKAVVRGGGAVFLPPSFRSTRGRAESTGTEVDLTFIAP